MEYSEVLEKYQIKRKNVNHFFKRSICLKKHFDSKFVAHLMNKLFET